MKAGDILRRARELVLGDRAAAYGPMAVLHDKQASALQFYLEIRRETAAPITAVDVAHIQVLWKLCRTQCGAGTGDNWVDMAGFSGIAGELSEAPEPKLIERAGG